MPPFHNDSSAPAPTYHPADSEAAKDLMRRHPVWMLEALQGLDVKTIAASDTRNEGILAVLGNGIQLYVWDEEAEAPMSCIFAMHHPDTVKLELGENPPPDDCIHAATFTTSEHIREILHEDVEARSDDVAKGYARLAAEAPQLGDVSSPGDAPRSLEAGDADISR